MSQPLLSVGGLSVWRGERHLLSDVPGRCCPASAGWCWAPTARARPPWCGWPPGQDRPSAGELTLLGHRLGRADVRSVRTGVGFVNVAFADKIRPGVTAHDVVVSARRWKTWWHHYTATDHERAGAALGEMGMADFGNRAFGSLRARASASGCC